jgi:hypothetical protein
MFFSANGTLSQTALVRPSTQPVAQQCPSVSLELERMHGFGCSRFAICARARCVVHVDHHSHTHHQKRGTFSRAPSFLIHGNWPQSRADNISSSTARNGLLGVSVFACLLGHGFTEIEPRRICWIRKSETKLSGTRKSD